MPTVLAAAPRWVISTQGSFSSHPFPIPPRSHPLRTFVRRLVMQ